MVHPLRHVGDEERRARLVLRHHLAGGAPSVVAAVEGVVALHSSDPATPFLSVRARRVGATVADVERALYHDRVLWRLHAMRRTLWIATTATAPLLLGGAAAAVAATERRRLEGWAAAVAPPGTAVDRWLASLEAEVASVLAAGQMSTRALADAVPALATRITVGSGRWTAEASLASRLLHVMAVDGTVVRTAPRGSWRASAYGWALAGEWFHDDPAVVPPPAQARAALLDGWLHRFGPATTEDVRWWFGWTLRQAVTALEACGALAVTTDDGAAWLAADDADPLPVDAEALEVVALLPCLDPTTMGWKARGWYMGDHTALGRSLWDRNGNAGPTVWHGGRVIGGWGQRPDGEVVVGLLVDVPAEVATRSAAHAEDLTRWLGEDVVVPRFRTPLERALAQG